MRSPALLRTLPAFFGVTLLAGAAALAACSSAPSVATESGREIPNDPGTPSNGDGSGNGSSGAASTGSSGGGTASSGGTSGSGSSSGSSSGGGGSVAVDAGPPATVPTDTTWADGMKITTSLSIPAGVTVTISPGATITVSAGVSITVAGTLTASTSTTHAKLTGTTWTGLIVPMGGTLTADSLDITGASNPIDVTGTATYANGTITAAATPISVETAGTLTMTTVTIAGSLGVAKIYGAFTGSHLDYDSNGNEGVSIGDPLATAATAVVKIDNSSFHGTNDVGADMITTNAGALSLTMTYTSIEKCHCAYHFNAITSFDIENMLLTADSYGFMMYGSSATTGTRVFKNSNVTTMAAAGIDESGTNGAIAVSGVYFDTSSKLALTDQEITVSAAATAALPATSVGPQP